MSERGREKKRGEQICLSVTDDDDIGHWVKEIERLLCEAGAEVGTKWRGRLKGGLSNERSTSTDSLPIGRPIKGRRRFRPTHHYKRQEEEETARQTGKERLALSSPERHVNSMQLNRGPIRFRGHRNGAGNWLTP